MLTTKKEAQVLKILKGNMTIYEICAKLNKSPTTIYNLLQVMEAKKLVKSFKTDYNKRIYNKANVR